MQGVICGRSRSVADVASFGWPTDQRTGLVGKDPGLRCKEATVHRILPAPPEEIDTDDAYRAVRLPVGDRPWVLVNMIESADGAIEVGGVSGPLGSAGDKDVFSTMRMIPDVILVGAGTAIAEDYGPTSTSVSTRTRRLGHGAWPTARVAVVSNSLSFDLASRLFSGVGIRPIVITSHASDSERRTHVEAVADVILAGEQQVDLEVGLVEIAKLGARVVLSEGGPSLNAGLFTADLVDELCVSLSPMVVGGPSRRILHGPELSGTANLTLAHVLTEDHFLFLRYLVER